MGQLHQIGQRHTSAETHNAVIAGMDLQKSSGLWLDGVPVVPQMGFVGGAHLPQAAAALGHDLRNPEGAADLHQFSPGDHYLAAVADGTESQ